MKYRDINKFIRQYSKRNGINLIQITQGDKYTKFWDKEWYINQCAIAGSDQIYVGIYKNRWLKLAGFLHQVGHSLVSNQFCMKDNVTKLDIEICAWEEGIKLGERFNIKFNKDMKDYKSQCIQSYQNTSQLF